MLIEQTDFKHIVWRYLRPPSGRPARRMVGGICLIVGLGRLGLLSFGVETFVPAFIYGWLLIAVTVVLWATAYNRLSVAGRVASAFSLAVLAALSIDVFWHGTLGSETSGLILAYLAYVALAETVSLRGDC